MTIFDRLRSDMDMILGPARFIPDRLYMSEAREKELLFQIEQKTELVRDVSLSGANSYAGLRFIALPVGAQIQNRETGEIQTIELESVFACDSRWSVVEQPQGARL